MYSEKAQEIGERVSMGLLRYAAPTSSYEEKRSSTSTVELLTLHEGAEIATELTIQEFHRVLIHTLFSAIPSFWNATTK